MAQEKDSAEGQKQRLSLSEAAQYLLDECRMVLPGIQTLFGFQLIVVFNSGFDQKLSVTESVWHRNRSAHTEHEDRSPFTVIKAIP